MSLILAQFEVFKGECPEAELRPLPDGSHVLTVPDCPLPAGWSKARTAIKFVAPVGYPQGRPDCFWTDPDLRLANGAAPQNTGGNPLPGTTTPHLWFSWHVSTWDPNQDNLLTFFHVIERRLQELR
jgi:hypothetical protein